MPVFRTNSGPLDGGSDWVLLALVETKSAYDARVIAGAACAVIVVTLRIASEDRKSPLISPLLPALADSLNDSFCGRPKKCQPRPKVDAVCGTCTSSMSRKLCTVSPLSLGRGPRAGSMMTFHGPSGGGIHSPSSRLAWPFPPSFP